VNPLVLSGTAAIVPSGTQLSCYQEPKIEKTSIFSKGFRDSNLSNLNSYGIYLTDPAFCTFGDNPTKKIPRKGKGRP
jgi:hypothetical protein